MVTPAASAEPSPAQDLVRSFCFDCHGDGGDEGDFSFEEAFEITAARQHPELWWKVLKNLRSGVMPPPGESRPSTAQIESIASWVKSDVFLIDSDDPDPGRLPVRRLNRTEYENTINDLMGISFNAKLSFPADDSGHGFDNIGDALSFSPLLMEKYLAAAREIVSEAVPTQTKIVPVLTFETEDFVDRSGSPIKNTVSGTKPQRIKCDFTVDEAGHYGIDLDISLQGSFDFDPARYTLRFFIDREQSFLQECGWESGKHLRFHYDKTLQPGKHELAFEVKPMRPQERPKEKSERSTSVRFDIVSIHVEGPAETDRLVHPPNYARFFPRDSPPVDPTERQEYAREVLRQFAERAFRSEVSSATIDRLVQIAELEYSSPQRSFEQGIGQAMVAVLSSPRFLFHLETTKTSSTRPWGPISELALASRLSYFLWSTMPDDELVDLASSGQLRKRLPEQIRRMTADRRSDALLENFVGQWLQTRDVIKVQIDPLVVMGVREEYDSLRSRRRVLQSTDQDDEANPEWTQLQKRYRELRAIADQFSSPMKEAMKQETEMFVESLFREDRSLLELIDSDYTFLNQDLAEHYGIDGVDGDKMRSVTLPPNSPRGGLLTQASMLIVTSNPTRTSPVKRGLFILENLLGTPAAPAPPGVPDLNDSADRFGDREPTLRELLAAHRESSLCASCHARMDPPGFALENFNALGIWRETDNGHPIDPSGELITGEKFRDIRQLKRILAENHASEIYRCITEKMLTYALGRGVEYSDQQAIDLIVDSLEQNGGRFSILLQGIVQSAPFQKQRFQLTTTDIHP
ncbi:DUF1592 domain-containing protein [Stieleria tagensis]|uniref:DUF1592 domain-containing protein n=1 Tax=Stieleria tagensis TaxID=2956795 RepID=UPI00209B9513|nr:DUF1592 domain-containing protein [Stieleria tagensis]